MSTLPDLSELNLSDAQVIGLHSRGRSVSVQIQDWQEQTFHLEFSEALAIEAIGVAGEDLSHLSSDGNDPFLHRVCDAMEEEPAGFSCFQFWSAWSDEPVMRIVAKSFGKSD